MTRQQTMLLAAAGSLFLLGGAFLFQAIGYAPCKMCLWQRWPHAAAILLGGIAFFLPTRLIAALGALALAITAGIGIYHSGVEQKWWLGPTSCTGSGAGLGGLSGADLLATDTAPAIILCDQISWQFLGLSMASYNAIFSILLMLMWLRALRQI